MSSARKAGGQAAAIVSIGVILAASVYLMAHDQVDESLGRTATVVSDKSTTTGQVWTSAVTTFASDAEEDRRKSRPQPAQPC